VALQGQGSAAGSLGSGGTGTQGDEMPWAEAEVICGQAPLSSISQLSVSNLSVSGQVNVLGNVVAPYFIGNGSQLAGMSTSSIFNGNSNVMVLNNGNVAMTVAGVANVFNLMNSGLTINGNIIATGGNVGNTRFLGGNVAVSGQVNVLGNVVAPFFVGNGSQLIGITSSALPATINIDINGNHIGSYANVANVIAGAGNIGTLNVNGNLTMVSNARIFSHQQQFMWTGSVFGFPNIAGNNIVTATVQGTNGSYFGAPAGWGFTSSSSTNQYGSLAWNLGFDFTKDFRVDTSVFFSANAGVLWISAGGSTNGGTSTPSTINNGSLTCAVKLDPTATATIYSNATVLNTSTTLHFANNAWIPLSMVVQNVAGKRYISMLSYGGAIETCADVSTWVPSGSFLVVGGNTAAIAGSQYMNNIRLTYL
jgi:hypothetical protein